MSKDWLIRTQSKQILGPVSREKILELLDKSMLQDDDEICRGSGYWFYIKESQLLERYLKNNKPQPFNPVSEAKDVLDKNLQTEETVEEGDEDDEDSQSSHTLVLSIPSLEEADPPQDEDELPSAPEKITANGGDKKKIDKELIEEESQTGDASELENTPISHKKKHEGAHRVKNALDLLKKKDQGSTKSLATTTTERNDRYLFILLALISLLLFGVYYYYKKVINRSIPIIETAFAQDQAKKKAFMI